ncbi:MAG: esterase/lipase family protein [Myxococcota bacterium]
MKDKPFRRSSRSWSAAPAAVALVVLCAGCAGRQLAPTLPAESELEPDRLVIFVHGYMNDHESMASLVEVFTRQGVAREGQEPLRLHGHVFDYGRFTRAGAGHNQTMDDLVAAFSEFYHSLPDRCPICRRRATRPVEVTIVAHSLGGLLVREVLLEEVQRIDPGEHEWEVTRIVTMGTPFFGSSMTRLTQGFLSIVVNGLVRTVVMGFVSPARGGTFGNTLDPQARAVRQGSPYLWDAHARWIRHMETHGAEVPAWLHVVAIGGAGGRGDGISRFTSTNIEPLLPEGTVETLLLNLRHGSLIRIKERGPKAREQAVMIRAIASFIENGTLSFDPSFETRLVVGTEQSLFVQSITGGDETDGEDLRRKMARFDRGLDADSADVWMRFYEVGPDPLSGDGVRARLLRAPRSFFRTGVERSPYWLDLETTPELSADGEMIPVVASLDFQDCQLVSIPEITPTGPYRMLIRLSKGVVLGPEHGRIVVEGASEEEEPGPAGQGPGIPFSIRPLQANLLHVMLDGAAIREAYPRLESLDIREVALVPER